MTACKFKIRDKVTTSFIPKEKNLVRTITHLTYVGGACQSGWIVEVTGGEVCEKCGLYGTNLTKIDADWFEFAKE
jgi:hypothetical protein